MGLGSKILRMVTPRFLRRTRATLALVGYEKKVFGLTGNRISIYRTTNPELREKIGDKIVIQVGDNIIFQKEGITQAISRTPVVLKWDENQGTYILNGQPLNDGDVIGSGEYKKLFIYKKT